MIRFGRRISHVLLNPDSPARVDRELHNTLGGFMNSYSFGGHGTRVLLRGTAFTAALVLTSLASAPLASAGERNCGRGSTPLYSAVYVIGDSLSDTGRLAASGLVSPLPTQFHNGRECNGPLWVEYFSPAVGLCYDPETNFSWAGAMTGTKLAGLANSLEPADAVPTQPGTLPGALDELSAFLAGLDPQVGADPNALYVVFAASNDFSRYLERGAATPDMVIYDAMVNISTIVITLHVAGAERIVVVDAPDISLAPRVQEAGEDAVLQVRGFCQAFNYYLNQTLDSLAVAGIDVVRVSAFNLLHAFVNDPARYGFVNVTEPSLPDLSLARHYLFWDKFHPTSRAHAWLAVAMLEAINEAEGRPPFRPHVPIGWLHSNGQSWWPGPLFHHVRGR
jgi:phospholipase/lecithinase/hemolysin